MSFRLKLKVQPGARRNAIIGWVKEKDDPCLKVAVTAAPERGQANHALIDLLAKQIHVAKSKIKVISGLSSRNKIVDIDDDEAEERLKGWQ